MMRLIPSGVKVIAFDAVGTLIDPDPPFWQTYLDVAARHGVTGSDAERLRSYFREAFAEEERRDREADWRTSEGREADRWRRIVASCFRETPDVGACFKQLFDHFARPESWRVAEGAGEVLRRLARHGYRLLMASNFDSRLRSVAAGLEALSPIDSLVISSEVGYRKPSPRFFEALTQAAGTRPGEILFVGDDPENDYHAALAAGMHAILFDPGSRTEGQPRITRMAELEFNL